MRVGRAALDEEAIRLIEEHNPDVEFDWTRILKGQGVEEPPPPRQRDAPPPPRRTDGPRPLPVIQERAPVAAAAPPVIEEREPVEQIEPVDQTEQEPEADGDLEAAAVGDLTEEAPPTPAHARLGSEGVSRLRARYAEVLARISERIQEPARQEELKTQAERLNPDVWVTADEVARGLEEYESVFAALRSVVGNHTRRRRRRRRPGGAPTNENAPLAADSGGEEEVVSRQSLVDSPESTTDDSTND